MGNWASKSVSTVFLINTNCLTLQPFFHVYLGIEMISSDIETEVDDILFCVRTKDFPKSAKLFYVLGRRIV